MSPFRLSPCDVRIVHDVHVCDTIVVQHSQQQLSTEPSSRPAMNGIDIRRPKVKPHRGYVCGLAVCISRIVNENIKQNVLILWKRMHQ